MDNQSGHEFDSDESDLDIQAETFKKHEEIDDPLSQNLGLCIGDGEKAAEQSIGNLAMNAETLEPYIGMEFNSRDEAREFYVAYGRRTGFTVRIHHNRRSRVNNQVIGQDFVCSKEGFRAKKYVYRKDRVLPPPPITREGCQAMIRLALRDGMKWVVTKFVKEHNHKLMSPSKVPWRGSGKHLVSEVCLEHFCLNIISANPLGLSVFVTSICLQILELLECFQGQAQSCFVLGSYPSFKLITSFTTHTVLH